MLTDQLRDYAILIQATSNHARWSSRATHRHLSGPFVPTTTCL